MVRWRGSALTTVFEHAGESRITLPATTSSPPPQRRGARIVSPHVDMPFRNAHVLFALPGSMALVVVLTLLERDSLDTRRVFVRKIWMRHVDVTVHSGGRGRLPLMRWQVGCNEMPVAYRCVVGQLRRLWHSAQSVHSRICFQFPRYLASDDKVP